jgi:glutathione S-transferase
MAAALPRKMAKVRAGGKCRLPLVSIAGGYGARAARSAIEPRRIVRYIGGIRRAEPRLLESSRMTEPILFGAAYSVYVRAARLALEEKRVPYRLVEVDIFAPEGPPPDYLQRHPFKRIPAFEHEGFRLYEATAITRYIDEAFAGPPLMPGTPRARARVNQIISIMDSYGYRPLIWDIFVERVRAAAHGRSADEAKIAAALPHAETCLRALEALADPDGPSLTGGDVSLADLHAAPMFAYFCMAREGAELLASQPRLARWWQSMRNRPSMTATRSPLE